MSRKGSAGYDGLSKRGYSREITVLSSCGDAQLDFHLEEFIFRFNRRTSRSRGLLFYRLIEQAVADSAVRYQAMVTGERGRKHKM